MDGAVDSGVDAGADGGLEDDAAMGDRSREALMRTQMLPETRYSLGASLVSSAFGLGCWSLDGPLSLRLIQVDRQYHADDGGDFAIVHHRFDAQVVPTEVWHPLVQDPEPAGYCDAYLP